MQKEKNQGRKQRPIYRINPQYSKEEEEEDPITIERNNSQTIRQELKKIAENIEKYNKEILEFNRSFDEIIAEVNEYLRQVREYTKIANDAITIVPQPQPQPRPSPSRPSRPSTQLQRIPTDKIKPKSKKRAKGTRPTPLNI